ncbi:prepilin-type cleavage/methylation domain-containing protein [Stenotrophomonas maltophilia]|nr:prepilin-type cleavage/methylation domain-containing protein [Stenotrophomonas maltophilia]
MKNQKGFTLIELMIVVAIIAILAAIAIPQYNDYTARAQMTEAFTLAAGLKTPIAEALAQDNSDASCKEPAGIVATGKYVGTVAAAGTAASCVITATMKASGVNEKIKGATVKLTYTPADGKWDCKSSVSAALTPKACTAAAAGGSTPTPP